MATTVATIDVGGTGASDVPTALSNLGAANVAAYAQANSGYAQANSGYAQANAAYAAANTKPSLGLVIALS